MRFSKAYIPTTKEAPKDAQLPSHIYLSRAGFVSQVAAGLYNFLPLGKRVLRKIETIINEEMAVCDAQEVDLSFVTPAELWEESGRIEKFGKELLRFRDRKENLFVLGPTHEEMMVNIVRNRVTSYKQLPLNLYQIKTKFRDEARPRFGLMRGREFVMKDGYSFHASTEDLDREFDAMEAAYKRILERLGLEFRIVEADSGAIGGTGSKELMVLAGSGEDTLAVCDTCEYGANVEAARRAQRTDIPEAPSADFARFRTPNIKSIDDLSNFFHVDPYYTLKAVVQRAVYIEGSELVCFFVRGCDELQEVKARNSIGAIDLVDATEAELIEIGLVPGFMGPLDQDKIRIVMDNDTKNATSMICGANEADYHFVGVDLSVMHEAHFADLASVQEGDGCPHCNGKILHTKGIEVGHIFKLGTVYSAPLKAEFLDENGRAQPFIMGTYGMGVSRLVAAVIEQHHDEKGCIWTPATAPYLVNIMVSNIKEESHMAYAEELYATLQKNGTEVILDDRKERFGFKMSDAELIGFPFTIIIGKELDNGSVQIMIRATREIITVDASEVISKIGELCK
ncbi:MAG: proline--tRNA ligase [Sulfuricurvum sp. PD_MW2]|jgi:prolyl-tRNA synthetase|uniref:proline--tRNA ligase n=1 Tax=Sulfuricurvum sp. PD_MW2 TaxID=2027917 RepID=UPI000C06448E|nr:proline--tRNA ligase [Sulfuricurvum sp. PD_MW2]PHM17044.1 MAG: proline--tRNA ligase [Sulfuricurvum sp. PD_MW2]